MIYNKMLMKQPSMKWTPGLDDSGVTFLKDKKLIPNQARLLWSDSKKWYLKIA